MKSIPRLRFSSLIITFVAVVLFNYVNISQAKIDERYLDEMSCSSGYEIVLDKTKTLVIKLSRSKERLRGTYFSNFECQFSVRSDLVDDVMTIVQVMNIRNNENPFMISCRDSVKFEDTRGQELGPLCGKISKGGNTRKERSFNAEYGLVVTIKFAEVEEIHDHDPFQLEMSFTQNWYCSTTELLKRPFRSCSNGRYSKRCISQNLICDGYINCGLAGGFGDGGFGEDELNCPKLENSSNKILKADNVQSITSYFQFQPIHKTFSTIWTPATVSVADQTQNTTSKPHHVLSKTVPDPRLENIKSNSPKPMSVNSPILPKLMKFTFYPAVPKFDNDTLSVTTPQTPTSTINSNPPKPVQGKSLVVPESVKLIPLALPEFVNNSLWTTTQSPSSTPATENTTVTRSSVTIIQQSRSPLGKDYPLVNPDGYYLSTLPTTKLGQSGEHVYEVVQNTDTIHLKIPVHVYGLISALSGGLIILLLSIIFCVLFCKFRQRRAPCPERSQCPTELVMNRPSNFPMISIGTDIQPGVSYSYWKAKQTSSGF